MARRHKSRGRREPEVAQIVSMSHDGKGIAAVEGKKVFVAGALAGEKVTFLRRKRRRNYDEAELLEVHEPAAERITPRCDAFGRCGGCSLQHISAGHQRRVKEQALRDNLERIGKVSPTTWLEPIFDATADGAWNYRRRARLAVKDVPAKGRVLVGFREAHAPYICDMHRCEVLAKPVDSLIDPLSELVGRLSIRARLPQIEVAVAENRTALVFRVLDFPTDADIAVLRQFGIDHDIDIALQTGGPASIAPLPGNQAAPPLTYTFPDNDVTIEFGATDFVQINAVVNQLMVARALELLDVSAEHRVLDLYCGIGNFSLPLARKAEFVLGLEGESGQVDRATRNAKLNGIENCVFKTTDLSTVTGKEGWARERWDRLLLDPARSGAEQIIESIGALDVPRIVYVSCHPGTLARDASNLVNGGDYCLEAAGIIDMFPHTGHVESIAVFQKN